MSQTSIQRHLRVGEDAVARTVLIPGDPARAERIAARFEDAREVIRNREFVGFTGAYKGCPVSVCSTGIGGPSAAIAVEELCNIGADTFIRVGSAGGRQAEIEIGSLAVATAAHRHEGTATHYLPPEFPALADLTVTQTLLDAARALGYRPYVGVVTSRDAFHRRDQPLADLLTSQGHIVAAEMECATVFVVAHVRRARAGAILAIDSNILRDRPPPEEIERRFRTAEAAAIEVALETVMRLEQARGGW
jgi:uridine phosphorylase